MSALWNERYERYGATQRAAIFKGLPELFNSYLHSWQVQELARAIPHHRRQTWLDLGCGYGRVSAALAKIYLPSKIYGLDFSYRALELFQTLADADAVQGSLASLPFASEKFTMVFCVTSLMYLEPADQVCAIQEMVRTLEANGVGVLIENEARGVNWFRSLNRLRNQAKGSVSGTNAIEQILSRERVRAMLFEAGAQIVREAGCPAFTLALPLLLALMYMNNSWAGIALRVCAKLDSIFGRWLGVSIYMSYQFRRQEK